jgi:hypothetical protein
VRIRVGIINIPKSPIHIAKLLKRLRPDFMSVNLVTAHGGPRAEMTFEPTITEAAVVVGAEMVEKPFCDTSTEPLAMVLDANITPVK